MKDRGRHSHNNDSWYHCWPHVICHGKYNTARQPSGPMSTCGSTQGKNTDFTLVLRFLPREITVGRPLSQPIKGRGWPQGKGSKGEGSWAIGRLQTEMNPQGRTEGGGTPMRTRRPEPRQSQDLARTPPNSF
jgi:hypothetical protein